jgi:hypothetical protein
MHGHRGERKKLRAIIVWKNCASKMGSTNSPRDNFRRPRMPPINFNVNTQKKTVLSSSKQRPAVCLCQKSWLFTRMSLLKAKIWSWPLMAASCDAHFRLVLSGDWEKFTMKLTHLRGPWSRILSLSRGGLYYPTIVQREERAFTAFIVQ